VRDLLVNALAASQFRQLGTIAGKIVRRIEERMQGCWVEGAGSGADAPARVLVPSAQRPGTEPSNVEGALPVRPNLLGDGAGPAFAALPRAMAGMIRRVNSESA
jgi:hypothetical protein